MALRQTSTVQSAFFYSTLICAVGTSLVVAAGTRGFFGAALAAIMLLIAAVDARSYLIPDLLTAPAVVLGLIYAALFAPEHGAESLARAVAGACVSAAVFLALMVAYRNWRGHEGLGLGDVKLVAVAGAWLDWVTIVGVVELACVSAIGVYTMLRVTSREIDRTTRIPFGLFLAPAIWLGWLFEILWEGSRG